VDTLLTPSMLTLTREAKGWTQRDLAAKSGMSQAVISKIESGAVEVSGKRLAHLAEVLECPPALLSRPAVRVGTANPCLLQRRRHSKLSAAATRRLEAISHLTRITVEGLFDGIHAQLEPDVDPTTLAENAGTQAAASTHTSARAEPAAEPVVEHNGAHGSAPFDPARADGAARYVRKTWGLSGPIADLIGTVESHGVLVVYRNLGSRAHDGVSSWPADPIHPAIIVINDDLPADRVRFTVAHQFGHLLLHRTPTDDAEREADRFAAEFLAPESLIAADLAGLTTGDLAQLARLKDRWGVSIGVLVERARDIGVISERQFREFRVRLANLGWNVNEPGNVAAESPSQLDKAFGILREDLGLTTEELAAMAYMTTSSFERHYLRTAPVEPTPRQVLNRTGSAPQPSPVDDQSRKSRDA
jgi:Zn-dependent peptidase ImmA (M78 family)/transcriptional regulator with XRE-family HTH domain